MIWESEAGLRIKLSKEALISIKELIAASERGETGGILIGRYSDDHSTAFVLSASGPGPRSSSGWSFFTRRTFGLQTALDRELESGKYYLGEWHCHPGNDSTPSSQDIHQMRLISKSGNYNCPEPILMVFGTYDPCGFNTVMVIRDDRAIEFVRGRYT